MVRSGGASVCAGACTVGAPIRAEKDRARMSSGAGCSPALCASVTPAHSRGGPHGADSVFGLQWSGQMSGSASGPHPQPAEGLSEILLHPATGPSWAPQRYRTGGGRGADGPKCAAVGIRHKVADSAIFLGPDRIFPHGASHGAMPTGVVMRESSVSAVSETRRQGFLRGRFARAATRTRLLCRTLLDMLKCP